MVDAGRVWDVVREESGLVMSMSANGSLPASPLSDRPARALSQVGDRPLDER